MRALLFRILFLVGATLTAEAAGELAKEIILIPQGGGEKEDREIRRWQTRIAAARASADDYERLGWAFVAKARRSGDAGFYKLADNTCEAMDAAFAASDAARLLRGHVWHNLHRFAEAEEIAQQLATQRGLAVDFALLSDVLLERGKLREAVAALQRMTDLKPGPEAYCRIAHLRWLKGDLSGAIAAMEDAIRASGKPEGESYAWMHARLAGFYLQTGQVISARVAAETALRVETEFAPALLAQGRVLLAVGASQAAIEVLRRAAELNPLPEYQWWLADALRTGNRDPEAELIEKSIKQRGATSDPRTLALFLATRGTDAEWAVRLARDELKSRADIFTHDALAWALTERGELAAAETEMQAALVEGTKDARIFFHAGEIARRRGDGAMAGYFLQQASAFAATLTPSERTKLAAALDQLPAAATGPAGVGCFRRPSCELGIWRDFSSEHDR